MAFCDPAHVKKIAKKIHKLIDIPWIPDSAELAFIEWVVGLVCDALRGLLPKFVLDWADLSTDGIEAKEAPGMVDALVKKINVKINLPILSEAQEAHLIRMIVEPIVRAMVKGTDLKTVLS